MEPKFKWVTNHMPKSEDKNLQVMSLENVAKARAFHKSFPQYSVTPLANLSGMANRLGLGGLYVKDESYRFGLNAFKVLATSPRRPAAMWRTATLTTSRPTSSSMTLATRPSSPPPTATTAAALPGPPTVCTRMPWCTCPRAPRRPASTTSPRRAPRSRSRSSTTTTACALPPRRPKRPSTA